MKITVQIIAIIASILAIFFTILSFQLGFYWAKFGEFAPPTDPDAYAAVMSEPFTADNIFFFIPAALSAIGTIFGIAGTTIARYGKLAGWLFIAAAVLCTFTIIGIIATLLFIICAVMTFIIANRLRDTSSSAAAPTRPVAVITTSLCACTFALVASLLCLFFGLFQVFTYHSTRTASAIDIYQSLYSLGLYALIGGIFGTVSGITGIAAMRSNVKKRLIAGIIIIVSAVFCIGLLYGALTVLLALASLSLFWPEKKPAEVGGESVATPAPQ